MIDNPPGSESRWQHFAIPGAYLGNPADSNVPSPALADDGLVIRGNTIRNGGPEMPLGIEGSDQGCQPTNPTCNAAQLRADNAINEG